MKDVRFGWLGESRRVALLSLISGEVAEWSQEWWIDHASAEVDVHWIEHRRFTTQGSMPFASIGPSGSLAMFLGSKGLDGIGRYLAGTVDEEEGGWAQRIGEEALEDLAARVYRRAGMAKPAPLSAHAAPPDVERADLGSGVVAVVLGRLEWALAMDRQLVDRLVSPRAVQRTGLASRQSALNGVALRVEARIDFGSINLTHLSDLRVGEVLVGDRSLEEALQLHVEGHGVVANGYLRRSGTQRAVMLDGVNSQGKHKP
ncbi:MAG: hypothetical protein V4566_04790 [Pseudomonadota bacterium]